MPIFWASKENFAQLLKIDTFLAQGHFFKSFQKNEKYKKKRKSTQKRKMGVLKKK